MDENGMNCTGTVRVHCTDSAVGYSWFAGQT